MHISEGVLSGTVLVGGAVIAITGVGIGLKKMNYDKTPRVAVLSSAFFVASLIHVPVGPTNAHLVLNGLVGLILGWSAFPALLVALLLQAILFQFGGLTTLGVNTATMALPAVICFLLFNKLIKIENNLIATVAGFIAGFMGVLLASILVAFCLVFTGEEFLVVAKLLIAVHIPIMVIEGVLTGFVVTFLRKVKPEILKGV